MSTLFLKLFYIHIDIRAYTCYNVFMIRKGATKDANDIKGNVKTSKKERF